MQEQARLPEFLADFEAEYPILTRQDPPPPGMELVMKDLESLRLKLAEYPPPDWSL